MFWRRQHKRFGHQLSAYIDGRLNEAQRRQLEAHLQSCDSCRQELNELRLTVDALRTLPQEPAPRSFALRPDRLERPRPSPLPGALPLAMRLAGVAAAFALAAVLIADFAPRLGEEEAPASRVTPQSGELSPGADARQEAEPGEARPAAAGAPAAATPTPAPAPPESLLEYAQPSPQPAAREAADQEAQEGAAPAEAAEGDGGIDPLRASEIALAAALGLILAGGALAYARRPR